MKSILFSLLALAGLFFAAPAAGAAEAAPQTTIHIDGMHCAGCAKSVASKLRSVKAVASADVDVKTGQATVVSTKGQSPSPRQLWEAVEAAGYKPTRLTGPSGTFQTKPKS